MIKLVELPKKPNVVGCKGLIRETGRNSEGSRGKYEILWETCVIGGKGKH